MTKKYHQLNQEQRYQLAALKKAGFSNGYIAEAIHVHKSTVGRELRRNSSSKQTYNAANAQLYANDRKTDKNKRVYFSKAMSVFVDNKMRQQQWSPEQMSGYCMANGIDMVSHERIYQYIYENKKNAGDLYTHLRTRHKRRKNRTHRKHRRGLIANRVSIHKRLEVVDQKQRVGDWEIDLIIGINDVTDTMVERKTQFALIVKADNKQADTIQTKIINALAPYKQLVHTITSDN